jgi:two-component system, LuxR family, response regulator FixJ
MNAPSFALVVEDDAATRESLLLLLAADGWAVAGHASAEALLADPRLPEASCIVADVWLGPGMDGVALVAALRVRGVHAPLVLVTGHGDVELAVRAMRLGAVDFLEKPYPPERLLAALREAVASPARATPDPAAAALLERLTPRERDVLRCLVEGRANKAAAAALGISPRTVETHRAAIMDKLRVASFAELVRLSLAARLLD